MRVGQFDVVLNTAQQGACGWFDDALVIRCAFSPHAIYRGMDISGMAWQNISLFAQICHIGGIDALQIIVEVPHIPVGDSFFLAYFDSGSLRAIGSFGDHKERRPNNVRRY